MLIPVQVDVPMERWPWMNWLLLGALVCAFLWQLTNPDDAMQYILGIERASHGRIHESPWSWIGHMFLHADWIHLIGNGLFMWVFGNAVCAKIGNILYALAWLGLGLAAGAAEQLISRSAGLGASGAINGIVGMYLVFYPINDITMAYFLVYRGGTFTLSSFWMILVWLGFDIWGAASGGGGVAYFAHLGGFAAGAAVAFTLLTLRVFEPADYERSLVDILNERRESGSRSSKQPEIKAREHGTPSNVSREAIPLAPAGSNLPVVPVNAPAARAKPAAPAPLRLHVKLANGKAGQVAVTEIIRHESNGNAVNTFAVSEDGKAWTTFGQWRKAHGV